jgi:hypothetical protein
MIRPYSYAFILLTDHPSLCMCLLFFFGFGLNYLVAPEFLSAVSSVARMTLAAG